MKALLIMIVPAMLSMAGCHSSKPTGDMVLIPGGEFMMGSDAVYSFPNERPAHRVKVKPFLMDVHPVTNAEFARFVKATGYVTVAERPVDWEELKKQVPPGTPKPPEKCLCRDRWYSNRPMVPWICGDGRVVAMGEWRFVASSRRP